MAEAVGAQRSSGGVPGYTLGERLGAGGFGEVFAARHDVLGREVAIKILHAKYSQDRAAVARFIAEGRAVNQISHPGIIEIFDFGELDDGRHFCVMERLRGQTLRDVLRERTRLPLADALPILRGIAEAVDAVHAAGIAHRDLKPDNVFVLPDGSVKLIDFGLAKLTTESTGITETGSVFGTPLYMSPEQCRGSATDSRSDIYSFGAVAYHLLVGEPPFAGDALALALHHLNDDPPAPTSRLAELPARVDALVLALMAKDPAERPSTLRPVIAAIAGDAPVNVPKRRPRARRRWPFGVALALVALGAAAAIVVPRLREVKSVAAAESCRPGRERLAGVWDPFERVRLGTRFGVVGAANVDAVWKNVAADADRMSGEWATQWDAACKAPDRTEDPLLYQQRLACNETWLLQLRGILMSLGEVDPREFALGVTSDFLPVAMPSLANCTRETAVREQRPLPPVSQRDEVVRLYSEFASARTTSRLALNAGQHEKLSVGLERMHAVTEKLQKLGASAVFTLSWWASYQVNVALGLNVDDTAYKAASAAVDEFERVAIEERNEEARAGAMRERARLELETVHGSLERAEEAMKVRTEALRRAGLPIEPGELDALIATRRGDHERVVAIYQPMFENGNTLHIAHALVSALAVLGRHEEAIAVARKHVAYQLAKLGENHVQSVRPRFLVTDALARAGRFVEAIANTKETIRLLEQLEADPRAIDAQRIILLGLAYAIGDRATIEAERKHPPSLAAYAYHNGWLELFSAVAGDVTPDPVRAHDALALDAFMRGDDDALRGHLAHTRSVRYEPELSRDWLVGIPVSPSLRIYAMTDRTKALRALREHETYTSKAPIIETSYRWNEGMILVHLAMWPEARRKLDAIAPRFRAIRDMSLGELDAFRGTATLESGDAKAAIPILRESIDITMECCQGFHYYLPMAEFALARALWVTDGDKAEARAFAARARDHYKRIGKGRDDERATVESWLAEHAAN